jgi:hypothetical protein
MAARFFVNGGVNNNYSTSGNWSATSGGAGGAGVPTTADAVTLDASSPNCTVDVSSVCGSFVASAYTNTLTMNAQLQSSGSLTFGSGMHFAGASRFFLSTVTATLTTNGVTVTVPLAIDGGTTTLADDLNITKTLTLAANFSSTINGAGRVINAAESLLGNNQNVGGTFAGINLIGTGTVTLGIFQCPVTINTAGTITFSTSGVKFGAGGSLIWLAGTVVTTGNTLWFQQGNYSLTGTGPTYNSIYVDGGTLTLGSVINATGTVSLAQNFNTTVNGFQVNCANLTMSVGGATVGGTTIFNINKAGTLNQQWDTNSSVVINAPGQTVTVTNIRQVGSSTLTYIAGTLVGRLVVSVTATPTPYAAPFFGG